MAFEPDIYVGDPTTTNPLKPNDADRNTPPNNPAPKSRADKLREKRAAAGGEAAESRKSSTTIEVRTADKKWWWRANRNPDFQIAAEVLIIDGGRSEGCWLLEPDYDFPEELSTKSVPVLLTYCITSDGVEFLFKATQSEKSPTGSTRRLITEARSRWIQSEWNGSSKSYNFEYARKLHKEPVWPNRTMDELLDAAFDGKIIGVDNMDVVYRLLDPEDEDGVSQ